MKRNIDLVDKSDNEQSGSSDSESEDEEPRIKDVLNNLFDVVSKRCVSDLLHSMAACKDILFCTP